MIRESLRREDYINRLTAGIVECTNLFDWRLIQLGEGDEDERERLKDTFSRHISQVEAEKELKVC